TPSAPAYSRGRTDAPWRVARRRVVGPDRPGRAWRQDARPPGGRGRGAGSVDRGVRLRPPRRPRRHAQRPIAQLAFLVSTPAVDDALRSGSAVVVVAGVDLTDLNASKRCLRLHDFVRSHERPHAQLVITIRSPTADAID